jgi:hypothetical protein
MSVQAVKEWKGEDYEAIVLAGQFGKISAAEVPVYICIGASDYMSISDEKCFAKKNECDQACDLFQQMILSICKALSINGTNFRENLRQKIQETNKESRNMFDQWNAGVEKLHQNKQVAPVPISNVWKDSTKVRKISFNKCTESRNRAPDPVLLLANATSNWLKRCEIEVLPRCGADNDDSIMSNESINSIMLNILEVDIDHDGDKVDEPLSDDE